MRSLSPWPVSIVFLASSLLTHPEEIEIFTFKLRKLQAGKISPFKFRVQIKLADKRMVSLFIRFTPQICCLYIQRHSLYNDSKSDL